MQNSNNSIISKGDTILFQGDSITDSDRSRNLKQQFGDFGNPLGNGYVNFIATQLMAKRACDNLNILNKGISGNTITDLIARWDMDCLELKPDVLSILIGVNDIWHTIQGTYTGTVEKYETGYRSLLKRTKEALPDVKLIICEPFALRCDKVQKNLAKWFPEFDGYLAAARKLSNEFNAVFVPFQKMFDNAAKDTKPEYLSEDGIHPTMAGAAIMAKEWLKTVGILC
jgi:lysophospholipase L1-like esterase